MDILLITGRMEVPIREGTQKSVVNLANEFVNRGHSVTWLTRDRYEGVPRRLNSSVEVIKQDFGPKNILGLRKKLKQIDPDVINLHTSEPLMATYWTFVTKGECIVTYPTFKSWDFLRRMSFKLQKTTAVTETVAEEIPGNSLETRYPVDLEEYKPEEELLKEKPQLVYVGSSRFRRGLPQACEIVKRIDEDVDFKIVTKSREKAENFVEEAGVEADIQTGFVDDIAELMNQSDFLLNFLTTEEEVTCPPILTLEAMACGRIAVCTELPVFEEFFKQGENGFLFSNEAYEEAAEAIEDVISQPEKAEEIGKKARETMEEYHSPVKSAEQFEEVYRRLI